MCPEARQRVANCDTFFVALKTDRYYHRQERRKRRNTASEARSFSPKHAEAPSNQRLGHRTICIAPPRLERKPTVMIRQKTLQCKLILLIISDKELLDAMDPSSKVCPACGAVSCCEPHGSYERWMITIHCGDRENHLISVDRVMCSSCEHTHALLSDILIPYSSYSLRFIVYVMWAYLKRHGSVVSLCEKFSIAVSTLYTWIHLFEKQANLWLSALKQISRLSTQTLEYFENIDMLPFSFFRRYGFSFLQERRTTHCGYDP